LQNAFGRTGVWQIAARKCGKHASLIQLQYGIELAKLAFEIRIDNPEILIF
jgi:hypothetical protein